MNNSFKLINPDNRHYKYAIKQEIAKGKKGQTAPHRYPPDIDLHPLINRFRNKKYFDLDLDNEDGWYQFVKNKIGHAEKGLTLGSGEGRHEKRLSALNVVEHWTSIDLVKNPLDDFTIKNRNSFVFGDLNFIELPENEFDLVYCHGVLHHIINLEHLIYQVYKALKPNGCLVVYEYVGEDKWQWDQERLSFLNKQYNIGLGKKYPGATFVKKSITQMNERPLESVRSTQIPRIIHHFFDIKYESYWNRVLYPFLNSRIIPKRYDNESFVSEMISYAIKLELKNESNKLLKPTELNGIYYKKIEIKGINVTPWKKYEIRTILGDNKINRIVMRVKRKYTKIFNKLLSSKN